ncbi:MAG: hypothetical protein JXR96_05770 [Deltaproteobacteria bacterium]|nr:hypothetical protein [Deltaproteobacteria bacterium]
MITRNAKSIWVIRVLLLGSLLGSCSESTCVCGDGKIDPGETCDGDCPVDCDDMLACTVDTMSGSAERCNVTCRHEEITWCSAGDGCCATGCSANDDSDCSPICGNDVVEAGETCDPPQSCPADCDDSNPCTVDTQEGSADNCDVLCRREEIDRCVSGDGCCPAGCNANNDDDCSSTCDNGIVEEGETCDPPESCPTDCDHGDSCTLDIMTGSADNCNAACSREAIRTDRTTYTLVGCNYGWSYEISAAGDESWGPVLLEPYAL